MKGMGVGRHKTYEEKVKTTKLMFAMAVCSLVACGEVPQAMDGVWSVSTSPATIAEFSPAVNGVVPDGLAVWSNGKHSLSVVDEAGPGRVFRVETDGSLLAVQIRRACDIEDSILEFTYRLRTENSVRTVGPSLRIREWKDKLSGIRLVPTYGRWRTESFPLARLMQGDGWRLDGVRTASSLEIGIIGERSGVSIDFASIRLLRRPTAFSPLVRPRYFPCGGSYARQLTLEAAPERSWAMVFGTTNFSLKVNGRLVGAGPKSAAKDGWATRGMLSPAADQWTLDGVLSSGENKVELQLDGGKEARALVVLGWIGDGRRHVVVSDDNWICGNGTVRTEALPDGEHPPLIDIYPLRGADAWCHAAQKPDYAGLPFYSPTNALLQVHPEKGRWGTVRDASGRWFLKSPSGNPFFYYAIQTINCFWPNIGYANWARRAYSDENAWAEDAVGLVRRLGFNGVGVAATADSAFRAAAKCGMVSLEHIGCADAGPALVNARGERQWGLADPFDPEMAKRLRACLAKIAPNWNARPDIFAICVGNEALIEGNILDRPSSGYVYSESCGREFVRWLGERYGGDVKSLNEAWFGPVGSRHFTAFSDVLVRKPDPYKDMPRVDDPEYAAAMAHGGKTETVTVEKSRMKDDFDAFAVHVVAAYAKVVLGCMRTAFPDKLIVSNRFMGGATREMYACWKDYDLIAVNTYPLDGWGVATYNDRKVRLLRDAHEATGCPVLLTEWGVQGMDVNLQSPAAKLYTQEERGRGYGQTLRQVVETMPFVAGMVDFGFQHLADSEGQGWGLVDNQGRPYRAYLGGMLSAVRWLDGYLSVRSQP